MNWDDPHLHLKSISLDDGFIGQFVWESKTDLFIIGLGKTRFESSKNAWLCGAFSPLRLPASIVLVSRIDTGTQQGMLDFMSTIEQIDQLIEIAHQLGYRVRYDYFGGTGGGVCEFSGSKFLFMDLALTSTEQLEVLQKALSNEPLLSTVNADETLKQDLSRRAA